jgi:transposase
MKAIELNDRDRAALEHAASMTYDARILRHCLMVLWSASGAEVTEISTLLSVTRRDVFLWLERFRVGGVSALLSMERNSGGRPGVLDEETEDWLEALLSHRPDHLGYRAPSWSVPLLRAHLARWLGEEPSAITIRRCLHRLGYAWKRPRYVLDPDPNRDQKMAEIRAKVASLPAHTAVLFEDETDLLLFPPIRSAWARKGEAVKVPIHGRNEKQVIFGAINIRTGTRFLLSRSRHRAEDFQFFLKLLRWHYRRWPLVVILDLDHSHTARTSEILARALDIELLWLPKRSPELNPMESLWGKAKDLVCANRQYDDLDDQVDEFISYLQNLSTGEALKKSGVLSGGFWIWKK